MDVKYLNYILEIAAERNITRAARKLFVSQSSLSQYLLKLEQDLGTPLFVRARGELMTTTAGDLYIQAAKSVVQIQRQLYHSIQELGETGNIRIGVSTQWGLRLVTELIPVMQEKFPSVSVEIVDERYVQLMRRLASEQLDMALLAVPTPVGFPEHIEVLAREEVLFCMAATHHYALSHPQQKSISVEDLWEVFGHERFILSASGSTLRKLTDQFFSEHHFAPNAIYELNSNNAIQKLIAINIGVALMPMSYHEDVGDLRYFSLTPPLYRYNVLAYRKGLAPDEPLLCLTELIRGGRIFTIA